jgi:uncharacterized protein
MPTDASVLPKKAPNRNLGGMRILTLLLALLALSGPAGAAGFDCAKASTPMEKRICADPGLSKADDRLAAAYSATGAATMQPRALRLDQYRWLQERNKIAGDTRLLAAYEARIAELKAMAEKWKAVRREVNPESIRQRCVVPPTAPDDATCKVESAGAIQGDGTTGLSYQLQAYHADKLRVAGGAIVFRQAGTTLTPIVAVAEETGYYEEPSVVHSSAGALLLVPGSLDGTGHINIGMLYRLEGGGRLTEIDTESWLTELQKHLPQGWGAWKGIYPDYRTFTARTPLWQGGDANCCPTAGRADIKLGLSGERLAIEQVTIARGAKAVDSLR